MKYIYNKMTEAEKWIICSRLGLSEDDFDKMLGRRNADKTFDLDIQFSINGVDVSFSALAKRCQDGWDIRVNELLEERTKIKTRLIDNLSEIENMAFELSEKVYKIRTNKDLDWD